MKQQVTELNSTVRDPCEMSDMICIWLLVKEGEVDSLSALNLEPDTIISDVFAVFISSSRLMPK